MPFIDSRQEPGHWGTVTAADVKFTWESIVRDDSEFQQNGDAYLAAMGDSFDNFEIIDDLTFRLTAEEPYVLLLTNMCGCADGNIIVPKKYYDEVGEEANNHPVGTGPWEFVSGTAGVDVNLKAVPNHWRSTPHFATLRLVEVPDDAARLVQVQSGAADIALLSPTLYNEAVQNNVRIINTPDAGNAHLILGGTYWGAPELDTDSPWIQADEPEKGRAIREAMSLAIDRQLILDSVMFGQGQLTRFGLFDFPDDPALQEPTWSTPAYDIDLARQKLADGGYPDGFPVDIAIYDQKFGTAVIGEAIAGMWEELGLSVNRLPVDEDAWDPRVDSRDTAGAAWIRVGGWFPEVPLMLNTISPTREDAKFLYPPSDPVIAAMLQEPDREARNEMARGLGTMFIEDTPLISLYTLPFPWAVGPDVGDWTPNLHRDQISNLDTVTHP